MRSAARSVIDINAVHVNPARPWQLVVGGADESVLVYDNRAMTSRSSSYVCSSSPAPAANRRPPTAAAGSTSERAARALGLGSAGEGGGAGGGAGGGGGGRYRRLDMRPLLQLCPRELRRPGGGATGRGHHVTCVVFGQNGERGRERARLGREWAGSWALVVLCGRVVMCRREGGCWRSVRRGRDCEGTARRLRGAGDIQHVGLVPYTAHVMPLTPYGILGCGVQDLKGVR